LHLPGDDNVSYGTLTNFMPATNNSSLTFPVPFPDSFVIVSPNQIFLTTSDFANLFTPKTQTPANVAGVALKQ
jgi:hypothetical protein